MKIPPRKTDSLLKMKIKDDEAAWEQQQSDGDEPSLLKEESGTEYFMLLKFHR